MSATEPPVLDVPEAAPERRVRRNLRAFTGLTAVQVLQLATSVVTGPLLARALGAEGRGLLAAVAVPIGVLPFVAQLGLGAFAVNESARGTRPGKVLGTLAVPLHVTGGVVALCAPLLAGVLAGDRPEAHGYLVLGLVLMPIGLILNLLLDIAWGLSMWRTMVSARALTPLTVLAATVTLYSIHRLDVGAAAIMTIVTGFAPLLALGAVARRSGRLGFDRPLLSRGLRFGVRAWPGTLASLANQRLDQLLMIPLVPARELGLYAVATTIAGLSTLLSSQIVTVVLPRIAAGEHGLLPQAMRRLLLMVLATQVALAVGTIFLLVPIFGGDFAGARPLVFVLLVGWLAQSGVSTLSQSLAATGRPGAPSIGEVVSLGITVPGLILLLPAMGAMGAAVVSLAAYVTTFALLLTVAVRHFGHRFSDYLIPRGDDVRAVVANGGALLSRFRLAGSS